MVTRFNERRRLAREVRDTILQSYPGKVLATVIRETAPLAECPSHAKTIFEYQDYSSGAEDYRVLAQDFLRRRTS